MIGTCAAGAHRRLWLSFVPYGDVLHVLGSQNGDIQHLRPIGTFTPDWDAVYQAADSIREYVHRAADDGEFSVAAFHGLRRAGVFLFDELFPFHAKEWLRTSDDLSVTLSLPPELLSLPWELVHTGSDFLCLQCAVGRSVQEEIQPAGAPRQDARASMLVLADPGGELDEAYNEGVRLKQSMAEDGRVALSFRAADVDASYVRRTLKDFDIVHFAGHIDERGWQMSDAAFNVSELEKLFGGAAMPGLVFANGCGATDSERYRDSMLRCWLRSGVAHFLGPQYNLPDRLGHSFAILFYDALLAGETIGSAVRTARRNLADDVGVGTTPWGAYVLYGDPDARYFAPQATDAARAEAQEEKPTRLAPPGADVEAELVRADPEFDVPVVGTESRVLVPIAGLLAAILVLLIILVARVGSPADEWNDSDLPHVEHGTSD